MQKQFAQNIFLLLGINLIIKPLYVLGIDAQVYNQVGDQAYGVYFALFNFCFLFQIFLDVGLQNYNSKIVSQNRAGVAEQFSYVLGTKLMLIIVFLSAISLAGMLIGYPSSYFGILAGVGVIMILQSMYVYLRSHFSALGFFKTESWLSALDKLLMIGIIGFQIYIVKEVDIYSFMGGQIVALVVAIIVVLLLLGRKFSLSAKFSITKSKGLLGISFPFALVFILMTLYTRMDGVMLERLLDDEGKAAGIYSSAYRLLDAANIIGYLFAMLLIPMFAKLLGDKSDVNPLTRTATGLLLTASTIISILCWHYASDLMHWIYTDISLVNVETFKLLMVSFWFMTMSYIYGALITSSGELRVFNGIFLIGIVVNWALNLYLIPQQGAYGAAMATLATQAMVFLGQFLLAKSKFKLSYSASYILKASLFVGISFALVYFLAHKLSFLWFFEVLIAGIILLLVSFLLGFFRLDEVIN